LHEVFLYNISSGETDGIFPVNAIITSHLIAYRLTLKLPAAVVSGTFKLMS